MKLEFDDIQDFYQLTELVAAGRKALAEARDKPLLPTVHGKVTEVAEAIRGTMTVSAEAPRAAGLAATAVSESSLTEPEPVRSPAEAGLPAKDADGVPHDTTWHSDPAKINADGRWRARRKRDEVAYEVWASATRLIAGAATDDADPVATETHALPQDDATHDDAADVRRLGVAVMDGAAVLAENVPSDPMPTVDHAALIEASQEAAENAPDGTIDLLNAGKEFIKEYGTAKFEALKSAVCPTEDGKGKAIPSMVPAERRLMRACMDNYALYL